MQIRVLKSKLHRAAVTGSDLNYNGSLTIDVALMEAAGLVPYEAILVSNLATGQRAETYVLPGERGTGVIGLNGAMARIGAVGDRLIIMAFAWMGPAEAERHQPRVVALDASNTIVEHFDDPPYLSRAFPSRSGLDPLTTP